MHFFHCAWTNSINAKKNTSVNFFWKQTWECIPSICGHEKPNSVWALSLWTQKFVCKSVNNLSTTAFSKIFYEVNSGQKCTRSSRLPTFTISSKRATFHSFSLKHRDIKFLTFLSRKGLIPKNFGSMKDSEVTDFFHKFRDLYILSNIDLAKFIFER